MLHSNVLSQYHLVLVATDTANNSETTINNNNIDDDNDDDNSNDDDDCIANPNANSETHAAAVAKKFTLVDHNEQCDHDDVHNCPSCHFDSIDYRF